MTKTQLNQHLTNYTQAVEWISNLERFGVVPGLQRIRFLLKELGNPETKVKFIHVAGTNGKGSTCAYLAHVLAQCGYGVGLFTSPNIGKFTNRIRFNEEALKS